MMPLQRIRVFSAVLKKPELTTKYITTQSSRYSPGEKRYDVVFRDNCRRKPASVSIKMGT